MKKSEWRHSFYCLFFAHSMRYSSIELKWTSLHSTFNSQGKWSICFPFMLSLYLLLDLLVFFYMFYAYLPFDNLSLSFVRVGFFFISRVTWCTKCPKGNHLSLSKHHFEVARYVIIEEDIGKPWMHVLNKFQLLICIPMLLLLSSSLSLLLS